MIVMSSTLIGVYHSKKIKQQAFLCECLYDFSNTALLEIRYNHTSVIELIKKSSLDFIGQDMLKNRVIPDTELSNEENQRIGEFIYNLGKYDIQNQIAQIESFKNYISTVKEKYEKRYISKSKLYLSLGMSFGLIVSLMII